MAELNTGGGEKGGKVRSKKSNPGVDLTAMVDLAFLLITFFILTTTLSKPQSMNLALPDKDKPNDVDQDPPETPAWRTLTVVLGKDNKMVYYIGQTDKPYMENGVDGSPKVTGYGGKGIRKAILAQKEYVAQNVTDEKDGLTVLIKAHKSANYKNVVDILDEMAITKPRTYAMVDITPGDIKMLQDKGIK
jgi:biopolymer transport protein ExbD